METDDARGTRTEETALRSGSRRRSSLRFRSDRGRNDHGRIPDAEKRQLLAGSAAPVLRTHQTHQRWRRIGFGCRQKASRGQRADLSGRIASQRALSRILTSGSHVRWEDQEGLCHLTLSRTPILFVSPDRKGRETNVCLFVDAAPSDAMLEPSFLEGDVWPYFVFLQPVNWRVMFRH
jgi:hypothetical protein